MSGEGEPRQTPARMRPLTVPFEPVGVARDYAEMQALLRELADTSGLSRAEIDNRGGLPDRFASKALASVPVGTCQLGAKTLRRALKGVGAVLIVARATAPLNRAADSAVKRRDEQVRARLLSMDVYVAAKGRLARVNGKLGAKGYSQKVPPEKRSRIAKRAARIRWRKAREQALADPALMATIQIGPRSKSCQRLQQPPQTPVPQQPNPDALPPKHKVTHSPRQSTVSATSANEDRRGAQARQGSTRERPRQ